MPLRKYRVELACGHRGVTWSRSNPEGMRLACYQCRGSGLDTVRSAVRHAVMRAERIHANSRPGS